MIVCMELMIGCHSGRSCRFSMRGDEKDHRLQATDHRFLYDVAARFCDTQARNLHSLSEDLVLECHGGVGAKAHAATANSPVETIMNLWFRLDRAVVCSLKPMVRPYVARMPAWRTCV